MAVPVTLLHGDCLALMPTLDAESIDAVVCDPPYGLSFMGKNWDHGIPGIPFWEEAWRVAKPGAHLLAFGGTRTYHRLTCAIEDAGWEIRDCLMWLHGQGFPKSHNGAWGGTALKPGWEPIILARKPLIGTVASNVAAHGTGALNIDATRIAGENPSIARRAGAVTHLSDRPARETEAEGKMASRQSPEAFRAERPGEQLGRWPANVVLDPEAAALLDEQSGERGSFIRTGGRNSDRTHGHSTGSMAGNLAKTEPFNYGDTGGASRFFYCAKASRAEREKGLEGMPRNGKRVVMASSGRTQVDGEWIETHSEPLPRTNHHPTVKPVALMRWLCRLITPPSGLILDPFAGSGTTGIAAALEGFRFLGIEQEAEYVAIAEARIAAAQTQPNLWAVA